ncbi:MAG: GTP-binding protein, partial [Tardiphaga sp.]
DHEQQFKRWSYRRNGSFDRGGLEVALRALPTSLLRLKGDCTFGDTGPQLLQLVGRDWSLTPMAESAARDILLVGVGTVDLPDVAELDRILDRALVDAPFEFVNQNGGAQPPAVFNPLREGQIPCR